MHTTGHDGGHTTAATAATQRCSGVCGCGGEGGGGGGSTTARGAVVDVVVATVVGALVVELGRAPGRRVAGGRAAAATEISGADPAFASGTTRRDTGAGTTAADGTEVMEPDGESRAKREYAPTVSSAIHHTTSVRRIRARLDGERSGRGKAVLPSHPAHSVRATVRTGATHPDIHNHPTLAAHHASRGDMSRSGRAPAPRRRPAAARPTRGG